MGNKNSTLEPIELLQQSLQQIITELDTLRELFLDVTERPLTGDPPSKRTKRILEEFAVSSSLYESNIDIRNKSRGTIGPWQYLKALEWTVTELGKKR